MKIEYELEMEDWLAFQNHYYIKSKRYRKALIIRILLIPYIAAIYLFVRSLNGNLFMEEYIFWGVVCLVWIIFSPKYLKYRIKKYFRKLLNEGDNSSILTNHELTFSDTGISEVSRDSQSTTSWNAIKKLEENDKYFFLYNSAITAIVIPKHKINADLDELRNLFREKIGKA